MKRDIKVDFQNFVVFRKWGSKGYSLFATLKKVVIIMFLSVSYVQGIQGQPDGVKKDTSDVEMRVDLDEIEISAARAPALYDEMARVVHVIDAAEIASAPATSINELLDHIAGLDVRQRGPMGVQADLSIRGGTFDQAIVLLNGVNITDPQTGHHTLNIPVSLSQIERIEILEGPAARVYGPNAFSGAVNIITRQPGGRSAGIILETGSYGYIHANLAGGFRTAGVNHLVAFDRKRSRGYIRNTDFGISNLFYSSELHSEKGKASLQLGLSEKAFGANSFYTPQYPDQFERTATLFSSARYESSGPMHFAPLIYWRRHFDKFRLFRDNPPEWYTGHNYHRSDARGAVVSSWFRWAGGRTASGMEYRRESILSNVLGEKMVSPVDVPGEEALYTKSTARSVVSLYLDHSLTVRGFSFSAGLMANHISGRQHAVNLFPGVDAGIKLSPSFRMVASFNTSMRMPTFTDLYYSGPAKRGNPDLKPERSLTLEGGMKWNQGWLRGHFIVFYRQGENMIDWVKQHNDELWQSQNLTGVNSPGSEIRFEASPREKYGKNWPAHIRIGYYYNTQDKHHPGLISHYVLDYLKHKFSASVTQDIRQNFSIHLNGVYQSREGTFTRYDQKTATGEVPYPPFWLFDGKITYTRNDFIFSLEVNNIFNREYYDLGNLVQPGRWIKAGVRYQINFN